MNTKTSFKDFVKNKINNFCIFLSSAFPENEMIVSEINSYRNVDVIDFLLYVKEHVAVHENDLDKFVYEKFNVYSPRKLDEEIKIKIIRYLRMFIEFSDEI